MTDIRAVDPRFYDRAYFTDGSKSNYAPYGPGTWADWIIEMVIEYLPRPFSVLDVGCAYGFLVERFLRAGIASWGFDISHYAIEEQGYFGRTWVGDCTDPDAWVAVDLALACELGEHLTPSQAQLMLANAHHFSQRLLMLVAVDLGEYDPHEENDGSHIHVVPMTWWEDTAREAGWTVSDARPFNEDRRSSQMGWSGRWLLLTKDHANP